MKKECTRRRKKKQEGSIRSQKHTSKKQKNIYLKKNQEDIGNSEEGYDYELRRTKTSSATFDEKTRRRRGNKKKTKRRKAA